MPATLVELDSDGDDNSKSCAHARARARTAQWLALLVSAVLVIPVFMLLIACVFGVAIALIEGWPLSVGFMYFASNMTGLGNPLTK